MSDYLQIGPNAFQTWLRGLLVVAAASLLAGAGEAAHQQKNNLNVSSPTTAELGATAGGDEAPSAVPLQVQSVTRIHDHSPIWPQTSSAGSGHDSPRIHSGERSESVTTAAGGVCTRDADCDDCDPCTQDECVFIAESGNCVHTPLPDGSAGDCSDGFFCNGQEECQGGVCFDGLDPCPAGSICNPNGGAGASGSCEVVCTGGDCPDDGLLCNGSEFCNNGGAGDGFCDHTGNPCGTGASCTEPVDPETVETCGVGRCCVADAGEDTGYTCSRETQDLCGGFWLGVGGDNDICTDIGDVDNPVDLQCPFYSAGITPQNVAGIIGPVDVAGCDGFLEIGDDYTFAGAAGAAATDWIEVTTVRYFGGSVKGTGHAPRITFYDSSGVKIVEALGEVVSEQDIALRTVGFSGKPVVPASGFIAIRPAAEIDADQRILIAATNTINVGMNDPDRMWVNGGIIEAGDPGPPGTPAPGNRVLAFEIVGDLTSTPEGGACCDSGNGDCSIQLPWICRDQGNLFQGSGRTCTECSNDAFTECATPGDCPDACSNDDSIACAIDDDCPGGTCEPSAATCSNAFPGCTLGACCDDATGDCVESVTGAAGCPGGALEFQGFGTSCAPNCCQQTVASGGDDCTDAPVLAIGVPLFGEEPLSLTVSGDNFAATGPDNCIALSPDPIWWEAIHLDACAELRIDFCCTEPPKAPTYPVLFSACPCGDPIPSVPVDLPIGAGDGPSHGFGAPFCNSDNFWVTFGPLPAGTYYYPIFSDDGGFGQYQLHATVGSCPLAACCTGETCQITNVFECDELGGYWLHADNTGSATVADCGGLPCQIGSCCTGPAECVDEAVPGQPCDPLTPSTCMDRTLCDVVSGDFVGGALCSFPEAPCPVCEFDAPDDCQPPDGSQVLLSDKDGGVVRLDNFTPQSPTLNSVCVSGAWIDSEAAGERIDCACQFDDVDNCLPVVPDNFTVTIYEDDNGHPGTEVASRTTFSSVDRALDQQFANFDVWDLSFALEESITGLIPGDCYWIEFKNNTTDEPSSCNWYWSSSTSDGLGAVGDGLASPTDTTPFDVAFCVDTGIIPGGGCGPLGACCDCDGSCVSAVAEADCLNGTWRPGVDCLDVVCVPLPPGSDDCASEIGSITDPVTDYQTLCATTDGPSPVVCETGLQRFESDIWFEYTAVCNGVLVVSLCEDTDFEEAGFDTILAIYGDETATCSCPTDDLTQLACDDDSCTASRGLARAAGIPPSPCVGPACGKGASELCVPATLGNCYTVRIGGVNGVRGSGQIKLGCATQTIFVDENAGGANNGTSWVDAFTDLQDAVELARRTVECNATSLVPDIWVAQGMYKPDRGADKPGRTFLIGDGVALYGGFAGGEVDLLDRDPLARPTILSGNLATTNSYHVVTTRGTDPGTILDGFIIDGGLANQESPDDRGGGMLIDGGSPTIVNCVFRNNAADIGGAVYTEGGNPAFTNCLFHDNNAVVRSGAIHIQGGSPTISNSTVTQNTTAGVEVAGGVGVADGRPVIASSILWENGNGDGVTGIAQLDLAGGAATVNYSCIQRLEEDFESQLGFFGNISDDPSFRNAATNDFVLSSGSPCIDAGNSISVPADVTDTDGDGNATELLPLDLAREDRFQNDGSVEDTGRGTPPQHIPVDMGAFEHVPDCNGNGIRDKCDLSCVGACNVPGCGKQGDCNNNKVPDDCDSTPDCNGNGILDECEAPDCNGNKIPDTCEVSFLPAELNASEAAANDEFGRSVAISEELAVVGSPLEDDTCAGGPCGDSGAAYVYRWNGVTWIQDAKLVASDAAAGDAFGAAVAIDGDLLVVGAPLDDDNGLDSGSAYVFRRAGKNWVQEDKINAAATPDAQFGASVSIRGSVVAIGAPATGTVAPGTAYVFRRSGTNWALEPVPAASGAELSDEFGTSVSIDGDVLLVGAPLTDDGGTGVGVAYVYRWNGLIWIEEVQLTALDAANDDHFGVSVDLSGDLALVGANATDDGGSESGSAYIFAFNGVNWLEEDELNASNASAGAKFGDSVSLRGHLALVGALVGDVPGTANAGSAYLFHRGVSSWIEDVAMAAPNPAGGDQFGVSVSLGSVFLLVGADMRDLTGPARTDAGAAFAYVVTDDCDNDGKPDDCNIDECVGAAACSNCNLNGRPDACDIADGTSVDNQAPNGVPDECKGFDDGGVDSNWGTVENWEENAAPTTTSSVTIDASSVTVDVDVNIQSLKLGSGSSLDVSAGDLSVDDESGSINIENNGGLIVTNHIVDGSNMTVSGGAVGVSGNAQTQITITNALTITKGGSYKPTTDGDPVGAVLNVESVAIQPSDGGTCSEMVIRDQMNAVIQGDFVLDGRMDPSTLDSITCAISATSASRGGSVASRIGDTPPTFRLRSPSVLSAESARVGEPLLAEAGLTVKGAYRVFNAAHVSIGCDFDNQYSTCAPCAPGEGRRATVDLAGDFDNQSVYATMFNWLCGGLRMQGTSPQTFEVAGIDRGSIGLNSFETDEGTNTEAAPSQDHTNFAIGGLVIAGGSDVTFRNAVTNTVGAGDCAEALYVDHLVLELNSKMTLDNCRVYFDELDSSSVTEDISTVGCGALVPTCAADYCRFSPPQAVNGINPFTTTCAVTDGTNPVVCDNEIENFVANVENDIWFNYTATCDGTITVSLCDNTDFDSVVVLYSAPTDPSACPPDNLLQRACANDTCGAIGGGGEVTQAVFREERFLIRIGGIGGDAGTGELAISCTPGVSACFPSSPAVQDVIFNTTSQQDDANDMNRYVALSAGDPGARQGIRLVIKSAEEAHLQHLVGEVLWVGPKEAISEAGSSRLPIPGFGTFWVAKTQCEPFFEDWNGFCDGGLCLLNGCVGGPQDGDACVIDDDCAKACQDGLKGGFCVPTAGGADVCAGGPNDGTACNNDLDCPGEPCNTNFDCGGGIINIYGESIVPGMSYTVQVVHEVCNLADDAQYSDAVVMRTSTAGDSLRDCSQNPCKAAGDGANINDVFGTIQSFQTAFGAPRKVRSDNVPSDVDQLNNITDTLGFINYFSGLPYSFLRCNPGTLKCSGGPNNGVACTTDTDCQLDRCLPTRAFGLEMTPMR